MPEIARALSRIATAMEKNAKPWEPSPSVLRNLDEQRAVIYTKEFILKYASEDELFALFHTFKEHYNETCPINPFEPLDQQIGETIKRLKANYK